MNSARIGSHPPCQGQSHTMGVVLLSPASASLLLPHAYHNREIVLWKRKGPNSILYQRRRFFTCMGYNYSFLAIIFHDAAHQLILFPGTEGGNFFLGKQKRLIVYYTLRLRLLLLLSCCSFPVIPVLWRRKCHKGCFAYCFLVTFYVYEVWVKR